MPPLRTAGTMFASDVLMQRRRAVVIVHDGATDRLRVTSNNKLILTK
ncbi:hemin uptake protein HemP [Methylorubrum thiocyanatum]